MATIHTLVARGELVKLAPALSPNELERRLIHMTPDLRDWMAIVLPTLVPRWTTQLSPQEQMGTLIDDFCTGTALFYPSDFHPMQRVAEGIWALKTTDVRIFGWFHARDCFIGVVAGDATEIKQDGKYGNCCLDVKNFRQQLDLDAPKHLEGSNPDDVLSNCYPS